MKESSRLRAKPSAPAKLGILQRRCALERKSTNSEPEARRPARAGTQGDASVPPVVHEVVRSPGQPLDSATRAFMELRFGHDFSQVRVHADARAAESARAMHALAYTIGRHVVFGAGQHAPATGDGQRLLTHELAHVVQQGDMPDIASPTIKIAEQGTSLEREADRATSALLTGSPTHFARDSQPPAIYRAPDEQAPATPASNPEMRIRQWLDQHQFAPPEKQPDDPQQQRHVLLNGEDMTVSDAVKLAAADAVLSQPPELISSVITAALAEPVAASARGLPLIGPGNEIPGINLAGPRDAFGISPAIAKTVELSTIDEFLSAHGFATPAVRDPAADRVLFDGKESTVEQVTDLAVAILGQYPSLKRSDVLTYIRQKYVAARGGAGNQIVLGYTLVPKFGQYVSGAPDPNNPLRTQHQFSFTITRQHHASDSPGFETSFQGSVTLTDQGILNVQAGGQEAIVKPLLQGWIQLSGLIQVMASENWSKSASGTTAISPAVQAAGGGQILLTPALRAGDYQFLSGHVQLGLQVLGGAQTSSSGTVGVLNAGLVLNIPF
jgi:hypothetical protein